jgi:hypothetical protein
VSLTDSHIHARCDDGDIVRLLSEAEAGEYGDPTEAYLRICSVVNWRSDHPVLNFFRGIYAKRKSGA